tara:strand:+ start:6023 stop:6463 length:441 start_codon:yes stop_codon:yes gene_type:complete
MDPVSAIAIASTAYKAIQKGFQIGKDIESMSGDIGRWMGAIQSVKEGHDKAKGRRFGSVEEEALETYAAKKKAESMENELRNFVTGQYGFNAWSDIIRIQGQLRKARIAERRRKAQQVETIITWALAVSIVILFFGLIVFVADAVL